MANPVPVSYSSPVQKVGGGREIFPNRLLDLLAGIEDGQWVKANTNTFESIFPSDKTPNYGPSMGKEWMVINAWSSMAWASRSATLTSGLPCRMPRASRTTKRWRGGLTA